MRRKGADFYRGQVDYPPVKGRMYDSKALYKGGDIHGTLVVRGAPATEAVLVDRQVQIGEMKIVRE